MSDFKWQGSFGGVVPYNIKVTALQATQVYENGYAYLREDGKVFFKYMANGNQFAEIDMGTDTVNRLVVEFTISRENGVFILLLKNKDGYVAKATLGMYSTKPIYHGIVADNVIKVAGGRMLQHDGVSFVLDGAGGVIPCSASKVIDIIPTSKDNVSSVFEVKADATGADTRYRVGNYKIDMQYRLIDVRNGSVLGTNFITLARCYQDSRGGRAISTQFMNTLMRKKAHDIFSSAGVDSGWHGAYETHMNSLGFLVPFHKRHSSILEAVGDYYSYDLQGNPIMVHPTTQKVDENNQSWFGAYHAMGKSGLLARKHTGELFLINESDNSLIQQIETDKSTEGYNYSVGNHDKFVFFKSFIGGTPYYLFAENEMGANNNLALVRKFN